MTQRLTGWVHNAFSRRPINRRRALRHLHRIEVFEVRIMLDVTMGTLIFNDLPTTKQERVGLPGVDSTALPVTYTVTSSDSNVTASIVTGGRSLKLNVSGKDSTNTAFTGDIVLRLFEDLEPATTSRIITLASSGFYNGLTFHRVIKGFVAQGGDPSGNGSGGTGTKFSDEFNTALTFTSQGVLAMANSGDDTNDSQFFITDVDLPLASQPQHLNFQHSIFGIITSGFDTFRKLMSTPVGAGDKPVNTETINSATVFTDNQNGVLKLAAASGFTGSSTITVTASNGGSGAGSTAQQQFTLNAVADTVNDRAFLGPVTNQTTNQGTPVTFHVTGSDLENDTLTFVVKDAASFTTDSSVGTDPANVDVSIQVTPASGSTPADAAITLTPKGTFSGTANLIVGVRDQTNRATALDTKGNFDTQALTLTVNPVNHAPTTPGGSASTQLNTPVQIQLTADDGDPDKTQTLTFEIVAQPQHGTIANFDAATGALQYTPASGFAGADTFTYRVHDNGGTANGGVDTSAVTTFTVNVGSTPPTGLTLSPASDDGLFNNDRVISNPTPAFTVSAAPGSTVKLLVNGTVQATATETSAGQFTATLPANSLRIGDNSITATTTVNGVTSSASAPLSITYAPSYESVYTVPGDIGSAQVLNFYWTARHAAYNNEIGVYTVDDLNGTVNGVAPGSTGYAAAALSSAGRQVIFASGAGAGATNVLGVTGGQLLGFYLVSNNSTAKFLDHNADNHITGLNAFFSTEAANPDKFDHVQTVADSLTGQMQMNWEDLLYGGDRDFNDAVITVTLQAASNSTVGEALRIPGNSSDTVSAAFTLQPAQNAAGSTDSPPPSAIQGELGLFVVNDNAGAINGIQPGGAGYLAAALGSSTRQTIFNSGDALGVHRTLHVPGGSLVAWYYTPGSTAAGVLSGNPANTSSGSPFALFSFDAANPDQAEHFRWFGPEQRNNSASNLQLHLMDKLFADQSAFDDFLISIDLDR